MVKWFKPFFCGVVFVLGITAPGLLSLYADETGTANAPSSTQDKGTQSSPPMDTVAAPDSPASSNPDSGVVMTAKPVPHTPPPAQSVRPPVASAASPVPYTLAPPPRKKLKGPLEFFVGMFKSLLGMS